MTVNFKFLGGKMVIKFTIRSMLKIYNAHHRNSPIVFTSPDVKILFKMESSQINLKDRLDNRMCVVCGIIDPLNH